MPACQQRHQHPLQEMILADHHFLHFIEKMLKAWMRGGGAHTAVPWKAV